MYFITERLNFQESTVPYLQFHASEIRLNFLRFRMIGERLRTGCGYNMGKGSL